jgi:hypothetical protein
MAILVLASAVENLADLLAKRKAAGNDAETKNARGVF